MELYKKLEKKYVETFYKCKKSKGIIRYFYRIKLHNLSLKTQIQIPYTCNIGKDFKLFHLGRVIINPRATIGNNVLVSPGVIIGQENRGKREGCPTIGNNVWIGSNVAIVGNIHIGDDVLIAPNAYVNTDVESHSVVFGNPCIIKHKDNAVEGYLNNNNN